jgi:hypothetical protein
MSARAGGGLERRRAGLLAARAVVGIALAAAASGLLAHGRGHFARIGVPDGFRIGLGLAELAAGALFAIPATAPIGAVALLVVIAWAAGLHTALHESALHLYLYMLVVAVLAHAVPEPRLRSEDVA